MEGRLLRLEVTACSGFAVRSSMRGGGATAVGGGGKPAAVSFMRCSASEGSVPGGTGGRMPPKGNGNVGKGGADAPGMPPLTLTTPPPPPPPFTYSSFAVVETWFSSSSSSPPRLFLPMERSRPFSSGSPPESSLRLIGLVGIMVTLTSPLICCPGPTTAPGGGSAVLGGRLGGGGGSEGTDGRR